MARRGSVGDSSRASQSIIFHISSMASAASPPLSMRSSPRQLPSVFVTVDTIRPLLSCSIKCGTKGNFLICYGEARAPVVPVELVQGRDVCPCRSLDPLEPFDFASRDERLQRIE